ncbi:MAG: hypothetical protein GY702_29560, partial [Desulfobulbaceae bacterium]|nr:hypothetical protein [Desulfobulbaceae bacterium]
TDKTETYTQADKTVEGDQTDNKKRKADSENSNSNHDNKKSKTDQNVEGKKSGNKPKITTREAVRSSPRRSPTKTKVPLLEPTQPIRSTVRAPNKQVTDRKKVKPKRRYNSEDESDRQKQRPLSDDDPEADKNHPDESEQRQHRTTQKNLIKDKNHTHDRRAQQNRFNNNYSTVDLPKEGEPGHLPGCKRGTRRKDIGWIEKDRPGDGETLVNFKRGQLLKIKKNMERANPSRYLRPYFRAPFLQPRLAASDKAMQQATLDGTGNTLKETKLIKANIKEKKKAYVRTDRARMFSFKFIRQLTKILNAMDESIYPH